MLSSNRKKIYIGVIVVATTISVVCIVWYTRLIQPPPPMVVNTPSQTPAQQTTSGTGAPKVFPNDTGFNTTIFDSNKFKTLRPGKNVTIEEEELGRENPFVAY